jgi:hypothetical protein
MAVMVLLPSRVTGRGQVEEEVVPNFALAIQHAGGQSVVAGEPIVNEGLRVRFLARGPSHFSLHHGQILSAHGLQMIS